MALITAPYPFQKSRNHGWRNLVFASLFVGVFLLVFQPFGLSQWQHPYKSLGLLGYGGVTLLIMVVERVLWQPLFPKFYNELRWNIGRELLSQLFLILLISAGNLYYSHLLGITYLTFIDFLAFVGMTLAVGIFPSMSVVAATYFVLYHRHQAQAAQVHPQISEPQEGTLRLIAENEKDAVEVPKAYLRYVASADNYATVVWDVDGEPQKELIRSSLSRLEGQMEDPMLMRVHRSYIANLYRVGAISGNAQGYRLHMPGEEEVPVSRKYGPQVLARLKQMGVSGPRAN